MDKYIKIENYRTLYSICKSVNKNTLTNLIEKIAMDKTGMYYKEAIEKNLISRNNFFILKNIIAKENINNIFMCLDTIYEKIVRFGQNKW